VKSGESCYVRYIVVFGQSGKDFIIVQACTLVIAAVMLVVLVFNLAGDSLRAMPWTPV